MATKSTTRLPVRAGRGRGPERRAPTPWKAPALDGAVAVVTGASRGAGRGIAAVLGQCGATVFVTGRSVRGGQAVDDLPGTIEDTAEEVSRRGGRGVAVRCDHTVDAEVEAVFARVRREAGRLDLLVNNAWGGYEHYFGATYDDGTRFAAPFWEQSLRRWDGMFTAGVRAHLVASFFGVPLMLRAGRGLVVCTSAGDRGRYLGSLYYDVAKSAVSRLVYGMARELLSRGIHAVAVTPGFMRTERVMAAHALAPFDLGPTESVEYVGRAVAMLAADPRRARWTGKTVAVGDLARALGFTDLDGRLVPPFHIPDDA